MDKVEVRFFEAGKWMDNPSEPVFEVKADEVKLVSKDLSYTLELTGKGERVQDEDTVNNKQGPMPKKPDKPEDMHIDDLNLKPLIVRKLKEADITTVVQLMDMTEADLFDLDGFGVGKVDDIKNALAVFLLSPKEG